MGTDPESADSDGDGIEDSEEGELAQTHLMRIRILSTVMNWMRIQTH